MIKQSATGLNSRNDADPFNKGGMLPIITAPMNTVVNETNYKVFLDNKIQVCFPRTVTGLDVRNLDDVKHAVKNIDYTWFSSSLNEFIKWYVEDKKPIRVPQNICIDTANGNMPKLHKAIIDAKAIHGDKLVIMAGNVSSTTAYEQLAATGVDYVRVGVGGGGACTTSVHTGVGQECLEKLIKDIKENSIPFVSFTGLYKQEEMSNIEKCKIVADGISSFIAKEGLHSNGYAAINRLLVAGADLVMIGSIFNKTLESAGEKKVQIGTSSKGEIVYNKSIKLTSTTAYDFMCHGHLFSQYRGMSTREEQKEYKEGGFRHSEGKSMYNKVLYTLDEWVNGSLRLPDEYPGFINCLKSMMSYTGKSSLK